ncbi:MAG: RidA family protein [Ignavibacteriaceae bacterium]|jgi:enamine deaminase RidA (YjgF/YER057c/UK114 family)
MNLVKKGDQMIEEKIKKLGFNLPETPKPVAAYIPAVKINNLVFTAGQIPSVSGELLYKGKIDQDLNIEQGQRAAEICLLNGLAAIKGITGDLDKIERIVKVTAFVNSTDGFVDQPKVANGASELLIKIFDEKGKHVRSAVGVNELPLNAAVEVEIICEVKS